MSKTVTSLLLRNGLAVVSVAVAVGVALLAQSYGLQKLDFPLLLIAVAVWYVGTGPGLLAVVLAGLGFDYFFSAPLYSLDVNPVDRPVFAVFVVFALVIASFSARRRRIERALRQARDDLAAEVVERTQQASLLDLTHDTIFVRDMRDVITYWNRGAEELYGWKAEDAIGQDAHRLLQTVFPMPIAEIRRELLGAGRWEGELDKRK